jgi:uncharacterized protein (DUF2141 family)
LPWDLIDGLERRCRDNRKPLAPMKATTLLFAAVMALLGTRATAQADEACHGAPGAGMVKLVVEHTGLRSTQGEIQTTVYPDDPRRFLARHGKLARARVSAAAPGARICFWLRPGTYAVAVYHDQNGNHDFDRNGIGLPAEGFGFSNDAPTRFGLPSFASVRFLLPAEGRTLRIRIRYQTRPG